MPVGRFGGSGLSSCNQAENSMAVSLSVSSIDLPSFMARCMSCRLAVVRRGLHQLSHLLHHRGRGPRWEPQRLSLFVLTENRRAVLVAQEPHQVEAGVLAVEVEHILGGGNPQPHPPELRELERVRRAEREE
jgi:hypothetical protein